MESPDLVLLGSNDGIKLHWYQGNKNNRVKDQTKGLELFIDIDAFVAQQKTFPAAKQGAFNQALGKKSNRIIDATSGWGSDALLMCGQGYVVHIIERHPLMVLLLRDAVERLSQTRWAKKNAVHIPEVFHANAIDCLNDFELDVDCIYLDPMFPKKRKKSAAVNKRMQFLQWLLDEDQDADDLLSAALAHGCNRIAVKRPDYAKPLLQTIRPPDTCFSSKLLHYDIYLQH